MGDIGAALARSSVAHASEVHHGCADGGGSAGRENDRVGTMGRAAQANRGGLDGKEIPRSRFSTDFGEDLVVGLALRPRAAT